MSWLKQSCVLWSLVSEMLYFLEAWSAVAGINYYVLQFGNPVQLSPHLGLGFSYCTLSEEKD